jgi:hypothetical protein
MLCRKHRLWIAYLQCTTMRLVMNRIHITEYFFNIVEIKIRNCNHYVIVTFQRMSLQHLHKIRVGGWDWCLLKP